MPSQQEVQWSQLKVGVIVLVSSIILVALLFLMTSSSGLGILSKKLTIPVYFENAAGLKEGAAVNLQGVTIGTVKTVGVTDDPARKLTPVRVIMKLDTKYQDLLKQDSKASLTTVGVLGDTVIDVNSQAAVGPPLRDGDELHTLETPNIQDVVKASQGTIEQLNVILAKMNAVVDNLQSGKGSVGQLINNPDLYNKADATVQELHTLEVNLNNGRGSIGKLMTDDTMYNRLNSAAGKLDQIATALQSGQGTAGKLLKDETLYDNLNKTLARTNALLEDVQHGKGAAGMLINDPAFAQSLRDTVAETHTLMSNVNKGQGHAGQARHRRPGLRQSEQAPDRKHHAGHDHPRRPEEVPHHPHEDLLKRRPAVRKPASALNRSGSGGCSLQYDDLVGLRAFRSLHHIELHRVALLQRLVAVHLDGAVMREHVGFARIPSKETISLHVVEPANRACVLRHDRSFRELLEVLEG